MICVAAGTSMPDSQVAGEEAVFLNAWPC